MDSILLVSPSATNLKRLKGLLVKSGFQVTALEPEDLSRAEQAKIRYRLAVVDSNGSGKVGPMVAGIRSVSGCKELPVFVLIPQGQVKELASLPGIEDFLVMPAEPEAMETRIRFLLNRLNHLAPGGGIRIGVLNLDVDRYEVTLAGEPLELTYKEFELLKFLATHPGRVFSRDQLLNQVWGYDFIGGTRTVDVHVRRLRSKLGPKYASLIDTVRNVGYKFLESL